MTLLTYLG